MKASLFVSIFTLVCVNSCSQEYKALDDKFGFRDIKLESLMTSFKDCTRMFLGEDLSKELPNYVGIKPKNPDLHLGEFSLESIKYWFYKSQLMDINIEVNHNNSDVDGILKALEIAYGKAKKNVRVPNESIVYRWHGSKVDMNYEILSKENGEIVSATLTISSIKLGNQQIIDNKRNTERNILDASKKL